MILRLRRLPAARMFRLFALIVILALYSAALLMPAVEVAVSSQTQNSATGVYGPTEWTFHRFSGWQAWTFGWHLPFLYGGLANIGLYVGLILLLANKSKLALWFASLSVGFCAISALNLRSNGVFVGFCLWCASSLVLLVATLVQIRLDRNRQRTMAANRSAEPQLPFRATSLDSADAN